ASAPQEGGGVMPDTTQLGARVAKLEEKLERLADRLGCFMDAVDEEFGGSDPDYRVSRIDSDHALMWQEELVEAGTPDEWLFCDWHLVRGNEKYPAEPAEAVAAES